jgi:hypothetical protein
MTHLAMSSGRSELVGSISAISAMRHMWSEMLRESAYVSRLDAGTSRYEQETHLSACLTWR